MPNDIPQNDASTERQPAGEHQDPNSESCQEHQEAGVQDNWRGIAQDMSVEMDAVKLFDLAEQLMASFESHPPNDGQTGPPETERKFSLLDATPDCSARQE